jgi:TolB-like protein/DNA-binding SARP family transcriptional activator
VPQSIPGVANNVTSLTRKTRGDSRAGAAVKKAPRIYLLGQVRVLRYTGEEILIPAKKTQALLSYLCLSQGNRLLRSRVAGVIWDRSGEVQARDNLRHALYELDRADVGWQLEKERNTVRLDTTACWIDAFESPGRADLLLENVHGISAAFDQWLAGERVRFEVRWQTILEQKLDDLIERNAAPALRAAAARELLSVVPTYERAVRGLMAAFVEMDEGAQAIREYERHRLMAETNGLPVSEKTVALYEAIRLRSRTQVVRPLKGTEKTAGSASAPGQKKIDQVGPEASAAAPAGDFEPSIAVLPFRNLSVEKGHDLVAEGLSEDLVEALSRVPSLFVISRLSAAAFKKQERPPREIGKALGARYVLSGTVRMIGERLRLIVELTDTGTGRALWVSKFDQKFDDLLEAQNRLAETVVQSVAPHVRSVEMKRMSIKRPEDHNAYDLFLRGRENMNSPSREVFESSEHLFESAIARQPQYATAVAWLAHWHVMRVGQGWSPDPSHDAAQADYFAKRAVESDAVEPMALAVQGHVAAYFHKDFDLAVARFDAALRINPSAARAWLWSAYTHAWIGEGSRAVEDIDRAMALSPYDPLICTYSGGASLAYLADGQYGRAIEFALRCIGENRGYTTAYKALILALVLSGRGVEARGPTNQLRLLEPGFTLQQFRRRSPACTGTQGELYCDAFATAGIPLLD